MYHNVLTIDRQVARGNILTATIRSTFGKFELSPSYFHLRIESQVVISAHRSSEIRVVRLVMQAFLRKARRSFD